MFKKVEKSFSMLTRNKEDIKEPNWASREKKYNFWQKIHWMRVISDYRLQKNSKFEYITIESI